MKTVLLLRQPAPENKAKGFEYVVHTFKVHGFLITSLQESALQREIYPSSSDPSGTANHVIATSTMSAIGGWEHKARHVGDYGERLGRTPCARATSKAIETEHAKHLPRARVLVADRLAGLMTSGLVPSDPELKAAVAMLAGIDPASVPGLVSFAPPAPVPPVVNHLPANAGALAP